MALGAGSACKYVTDGGKTVTRSENVKDVTNYIERIDEMIERKRNKLEEIAWL
jgi:oxygen-independent coproporphyrinogen-3 oxidase